MTRSSSRNIILLIMALFVAASMWVMGKDKDIQQTNSVLNKKLNRLKAELKRGAHVSGEAALLDKKTINEKQATTLDILRHLGLEESALVYKTRSKISRQVSGITLYTRSFVLEGQVSYREALEQIDSLHGTEKVVIDKVVLVPGEGFGDIVKVSIEGTLYGLDK